MCPDRKYKTMELPPCHCEAQGGWCEPRNEAIACYTGRTSIVRDCFAQTKGVMLRHSKHGGQGFVVLLVLFCLFLSGNAVAQSNNSKTDSIPKKVKTIYQLYEHIKTQPGTSDPLIMVDDSVYNGDLHNIKSEDVTSVSIIKGDDAKAIFGPKAKNGVFNIKIKHHEDQASLITGPERKFSDGPVVYVMDGMPIPKELVSTDDILIKEVVTGKKLEELGAYLNKKLDSAVFITTKKYATLDYQMKFSTFSKKYEDFLSTHKSHDDSCSYILNGVIIPNDSNERIKKLYIIKPQEITGIGIAENPGYNGGESRKYLVLINTKQ